MSFILDMEIGCSRKKVIKRLFTSTEEVMLFVQKNYWRCQTCPKKGIR